MGGTYDVADYRDIVLGHQDPPVPGATGLYARIYQAQNRNRVLVPYVAKPFYWLVRGHVGTWDPVLFGLLIANAIFTATTACLLVAIGYRLTLNLSTALLGAPLFLLNFCITNFSLAGMVDSAEGCFLMLIAWSLLTGRWFLLPLWGVFGALAKETFAPLSVIFVFGWWLSEVRRDRLQLSHVAWMTALGFVSITTVTIVMSTVAGGLVWPWQYAAFVHDPHRLRDGNAEMHSQSWLLVHIYLASPVGAGALAPPAPALGTGHCCSMLWSLGVGRLQQRRGQHFTRLIQCRRTHPEPIRRGLPRRHPGCERR